MTTTDRKFVGIQISPVSFIDEGVEAVLETLQERVGVNVLMIGTISWLGFQTAFSFFKFGPGTAILYTLTALCLLVTVLYQRLLLARFEPEA